MVPYRHGCVFLRFLLLCWSLIPLSAPPFPFQHWNSGSEIAVESWTARNAQLWVSACMQSPSPLPMQPPCPQNTTQRLLPHRRTVTPREALRGACSGSQKGKEPGSSSSCGMLPHQDTALALVDNTVGPSSSPLASLPPRIICSVPGIKTTSNKYIGKKPPMGKSAAGAQI
ncbi:hypothetical protein B0H16DRAFT_581910 [Mycena metata]|uniref:Secreted protein n=1 Tax=Mycena metata TaxID=1033252 RepID=A0AAD7MDF9_9AGAR|nr:hypothetical protein B0H16DRAFT_581910 [Mycena metata]